MTELLLDPGSAVGEEDMLDEIRRISSSMEALAASLEALRDLPGATEDVREAVRDQTEVGSALMSESRPQAPPKIWRISPPAGTVGPQVCSSREDVDLGRSCGL